MISIFLPAYNSKELINKVFLTSLEKNTVVPWQLIIHDNGGNDWEDMEMLSQYRSDLGRITMIGNEDNVGLNVAFNRCYASMWNRHDYIFLPHTDMYLLPGWDTGLLNAAKGLVPGSYLFCSRSVEPTQGHTSFHVIEDFGLEPEEFDEEKLLKWFLDYKDKSVVTGYRMPFFMHRRLWERMGGVDENLFSYATDDDIMLEAYDTGVRRFWMVNGSLVYHLQGKSNKTQSVDRDSKKPYDYLVDKWSKKGYNITHNLDQSLKSLVPWYVRIR